MSSSLSSSVGVDVGGGIEQRTNLGSISHWSSFKLLLKEFVGLGGVPNLLRKEFVGLGGVPRLPEAPPSRSGQYLQCSRFGIGMPHWPQRAVLEVVIPQVPSRGFPRFPVHLAELPLAGMSLQVPPLGKVVPYGSTTWGAARSTTS